MMTSSKDDACLLCQGPAADTALSRVQVWDNDLWRLTVSLEAEVPGFDCLAA